MPLYEYRCDDCANSFDVLTSYAERDKAHVCPQCESLKTNVLVSSFAAFGDGLKTLDAGDFGGAAATGGGCCGGSCGCGHN